MPALVLILLIALSTPALAQPMQPQQPMPPQLQITEEQQELLDQGEISLPRYLTGGGLATFIGFGVGQGVQGRWKSRGWMFTVGDSVAVAVTLYGAARCCGPAGNKEEYMVLGGLAALIGLRIWQTVDAWLVPPEHNRRVRALRGKLGLAPPTISALYLAPPQTPDASGVVAGLSLSF
ncbi:MAG: hypothetical protein H0T42_14475 [Deltaproteobacteria bacterium]|nr:hypothetical protein [Deltaproteobacteria bacterium]